MKAKDLRSGDIINGYFKFIRFANKEGNPCDLFIGDYLESSMSARRLPEMFFHIIHLKTVHRDGKQIYPEVKE